MDPYSELDRSRLFDAIRWHWRALRPFRKNRRDLIEAYAGSLFGAAPDSERRKRILVNLMLQTAEAHMLAIAGGTPRFQITGRTQQLSGFARKFQLTLNNLVKEIRFKESIQQCALDAFFGISAMKVYLASAPAVQVEWDVWMDPGQPYASRISADDFVFDTGTPDFRKATFSADRYRIPFDMVREDGRFQWDEIHNEQIKPTSRRELGERDELARNIARGEETDKGEFELMVDLLEVYLPKERRVVTWAVQPGMNLVDTPPLSDLEWSGEETGPYHLLNLGPVPDNVMPTSPAQNLRYLFELVNSSYRKLDSQARRQKFVHIIEAGAEDDARRVRESKDGGQVTVAQKDAQGEMRLGGIDQQLLIFANNIIDLHDRMGGNVTARMGLGAQSPTATQDQMIHAQTGRHEQFMQEKMVDFTRGVGKHLAWLLFGDPVRNVKNRDKVEGTSFEFENNWTPDERQGQFNDYDFDVDPYSLAYQSPSDKANVLTQFIGQMMPMLPLLQQMGWQIDLPKFLTLQAELRNIPQLLEIFKPAAPPEEQGAGGANQATQSPVTQRETIRRGQPGQGPSAVGMMQMLRGGQNGSAQMAEAS